MTVDNVITEWLIDGAWTSTAGGVDLDERVRKSPGVRISRGVSDQQSQATAASSEYEVNDADGVFSNRNPLSPLFRKIPRFTQVRHRIPTSTGIRDSYVLSRRPDISGKCTTADKAGLEITGDIDIRFEITPDTWAPLNGYSIVGRYRLTGNNRSWLVWLNYASQFTFRWSTDGAATNQADFSGWDHRGRQIVRITLDVNNGASGRTATLYRGDTMSGPWTQVSQVIQSGTTSIYGSSTAPLEVGNINDSGSPITDQTQMFGKFHQLQVRNGIDGTVVADLDVQDQDVGDTSWSDAYGNTWNLENAFRVGSDRIRHVGEIDSIEYNWDETERDVWLPQTSLGPLNRLQETGTPVSSPLANMYRQFPASSGYWRLEDGPDATKALGEGTSINTSVLTDCSFTGSSPSGLPGSAGSLRLNSSSSVAWLGAAGRVGTGENTIIFCFKLNSLPAATTTLVTMTGNGTIRRWDFRIGPTNIALNGYNVSGTAVVTENAIFGANIDPSTEWVMWQITLTQEGGNVRYTTRWIGVDGVSTWKTNAIGGSTYAGSVGLIGQWRAAADGESAFAGAEFAHVVNGRDVFSVNTVDNAFVNATLAWVGETPADRAERIAQENNIDLEIYGNTSDSQPMGPQPIDTPLVILNECAKVDNAVLFDVRDRFAIGFRTRVDMENRFYENLTVPYEDSLINLFRPREDSRFTKNRFTASRVNGGSSRWSLSEGPLSIQEPPNGIGPREGGDTYNAYTDEQIERIAQYQVWLRTQDELRIPSLTFELHRSQLDVGVVSPRERIIAMQLGDWIRLESLPLFVDYDNVKYFIVLGYIEQFNGHLWNITPNIASAESFRVPWANFFWLADDGTTTLKTSLTTTGTSNTLVTPVGHRPWLPDSHADWEGYVSVYIGGELCRITACGSPSIVGSNYEQTVTLSRSLNDVVKTQSAGEDVVVSQPYFLGL